MSKNSLLFYLGFRPHSRLTILETHVENMASQRRIVPIISRNVYKYFIISI